MLYIKEFGIINKLRDMEISFGRWIVDLIENKNCKVEIKIEGSIDKKFQVNTCELDTEENKLYRKSKQQINKNYKYRNYATIRWRVLYEIFNNLSITDNDILVDCGSGLGKVLVAAGKFSNIKQIIGVEICKSLYIKSLENTNKISKNIDIINQDILKYSFPKEANLFFFFNPFNISVFMEVFKNIYNNCNRDRDFIFILHRPKGEIIDFLSEYCTLDKRIDHKNIKCSKCYYTVYYRLPKVSK